MGWSVRTERLDLRPLSREVARALLVERDVAARSIGAELPPDWPDLELVPVLRRYAEMSSEQATWNVWPIIDRRQATVVGDFTFLGPPSQAGEVGIAYFVAGLYRRQGYATEAARALVAWAQQQPEVNVVAAACADSNQASIRTLRRIGFEQIDDAGGELRWRLVRTARALPPSIQIEPEVTGDPAH